MPRLRQGVVTVVGGLAAVAGCRDSSGGTAGTPADSGRVIQADSLVARNGDGVEIWFTLRREAVDSNGARCSERGIEIRHGGTRVKVPLLYTGSAPVFLNDSTIRARLWNRCEPGDVYLVDVRSGRPTREHDRGKP
ncbi:MAG TPA: hypothetical protein VF252_08285 [Gemmatimonadales bacterium]